MMMKMEICETEITVPCAAVFAVPVSLTFPNATIDKTSPERRQNVNFRSSISIVFCHTARMCLKTNFRCFMELQEYDNIWSGKERKWDRVDRLERRDLMIVTQAFSCRIK